MKKVYIFKIYPASEIYPDEMLGQDDCPPYVINTYIYNGTLGEAMWAVANTVGCYANAFELAPEEFNERLVYLQEHMRDEDFETYLQNEYI